jgi:hypothetical protein
MRLFAVLVGMAMVAASAEGSMCKILLRAYYNFKSIEPLKENKLYAFEGGNSQLMYRLCTNFNNTLDSWCDGEEDYGNLVLVENRKCRSVADIEKRVNKQVWKVGYSSWLEQYFNSSNPQENAAVNSEGTAITYQLEVTDQTLLEKGITSINFGLVCNSSKGANASVQINKLKDKELWFFFEGKQACGFGLIEPSVFMRNHISFPATFIILSLVMIILRRFSERWLMAVFGMQFGIFITIVSMANLELQFHFTDSTTVALYACSLVVGGLFSFACYVSRNNSIMVLFLGAAVSGSYTLLSVYVMLTHEGIPSEVFWATILVLATMMILCYNVPSFYDNYAHMFIISIDVPFYLFMSMSVIVGWYPDLLTIRKAQEYEISLEARKQNWWFLGGQFLLTLVLTADSILLFRRSQSEKEEDRDTQDDAMKAITEVDSQDLQSM